MQDAVTALRKARSYVETATHGILTGAAQEARYTLQEIDDSLRTLDGKDGESDE